MPRYSAHVRNALALSFQKPMWDLGVNSYDRWAEITLRLTSRVREEFPAKNLNRRNVSIAVNTDLSVCKWLCVECYSRLWI